MRDHYLSLNEESVLLDAAIGADDEAWGILYNSFVLPVRGFIAGQIGAVEDAEDLAQECFIRAKKGLEEGLFDRQYRFYTFLRSIAVHLVQDYWRYRSKTETRLRDHAGREEDSPLAFQPSFSPLERLELLRLVFVCGAKLHQILMFCFVKLLEWRPREVVKERSDSSLGSLTDEFLASYYAPLEQFLSRTTFYDTYCSALLDLVSAPVDEVYRELEYQSLRKETHSAVGRLILRQFFGCNPAANISDWCDRVRIRTRKLLSETNIGMNDAESVVDTGW
jgi:DNA-directed RNA polymerase specialized sigma24 family protein